jgi:oxalate decarboxylase
VPKKDLWIFNAPLPGSLADDQAQSKQPDVPNPYSFALLDQKPVFKSAGGSVRIADKHNFKATTMAAALVEIEPGGMRELHWHPNTNEWQYYIEGQARMAVFAASGQARTFDFEAGDVGYVPFAMGHYIENRGNTAVRFLEVFRSNYYADVSLNQWLALTPPELVQAHLKVDQPTLAAFRKEKSPVVPA